MGHQVIGYWPDGRKEDQGVLTGADGAASRPGNRSPGNPAQGERTLAVEQKTFFTSASS